MGTIKLNLRGEIAALRFVNFVLTGVFLLFGPALKDASSLMPFAILGLYLLSILTLLPVRRELMRHPFVQGAIYLIDIGFISWAVYASGAASSELYLLYFAAILITGTQTDPRHSFLVGAVACTLYAVLCLAPGDESAALDISVALRFPFFFVTAFFTAYFAQQARTLKGSEKRLRRAEKLSTVGRLAGGIAHEFNNLLTVILSAGALLENEAALRIDERGLLRDIREAGERATLLTRQLLQFSRQQLTLRSYLHLHALFESLREPLRRILGDDIRIVLQLEAERDLVHIDEEQFRQALLSLAANAHEAMPNGGIFELATRSIAAAECSRSMACIRLSVRDDGCGMDERVLEHLFEPFFTTKEIGQGTGLSLASVHGIIQSLGGAISVDSAPQRGTRFLIYLPEAAAERAQSGITTLSSPAGGAG